MLVVPEIPWFGNTDLEGLQGTLFWSEISTLLGFQSWEVKALTQASWRTLRGLSLAHRNRSLGRKMSALRVISKQSYNLKKRDEVSEDHSVVSDSLWYHGLYILQARILEWGAFPFSKGSSQHRDWTQVSSIAGGFFTSWAWWREAQDTSIYHSFTSSLFTYFSQWFFL